MTFQKLLPKENFSIKQYCFPQNTNISNTNSHPFSSKNDLSQAPAANPKLQHTLQKLVVHQNKYSPKKQTLHSCTVYYCKIWLPTRGISFKIYYLVLSPRHACLSHAGSTNQMAAQD